MDILLSKDIEAELLQTPSGDILAYRYDVATILERDIGEDWQARARQLVKEAGKLSVRNATDETCREAKPHELFGIVTVQGEKIVKALPGLVGLYKGAFQELMVRSMPSAAEPLTIYDDPELALELYAQVPAPGGQDGVNYRLDAHVDGRYTAVLALAAPNKPNTGRLVISHNPDAGSVDEINRAATRISHIPGTLICFPRGRELPHYTESLERGSGERSVISINYPLVSEPVEAALRLHEHFKGDSI